jgi:arylsulfatase A-like enzyme
VADRDVWELYNLKNDPVEEINLIDREPEKAAALEKQYTAWAQQFSN